MPIDTRHRDYDAHASFWERCRHAIDGEDTVKQHALAKGYLPKLEGQDDRDYEGYRDRAMYYNASGRTVQAVVGAIFRKPITVDPDVEEYDGTLFSKRMERHARECVEEVGSTGRFGVLADMPPLKPGEEPQPPYLLVYRAEEITNWRVRIDGDREVPTLVVLYETADEVSEDDPYTVEVIERYRELFIGEDGYYHQRLWVKEKLPDGKIAWLPGPETTPLALGMPLTEIPFEVANWSRAGSWQVKKPPLLDLVNVNMSHFRTSADLEHGRHFTALPTAWVAGFDSKTELKIGSATAWVTENPAAHAGYLEFSGSGLGHLADALKEKQELLAILGARLFMPSDRANVAAETVRLQQGADTANAQSIANVVGDTLTKAFRNMLKFVRGAEPMAASVELNNDVLDVPLDVASIQTLFGLMQQGAISQDTFLYNLQRGEVLPPDVSIDDEKAKVEMDDGRFARGEFRFAMPNPAEEPATPPAKGAK